MEPRIFARSSGRQAKLVQALTRGLEEVCEVGMTAVRYCEAPDAY